MHFAIHIKKMACIFNSVHYNLLDIIQFKAEGRGISSLILFHFPYYLKAKSVKMNNLMDEITASLCPFLLSNNEYIFTHDNKCRQNTAWFALPWLALPLAPCCRRDRLQLFSIQKLLDRLSLQKQTKSSYKYTYKHAKWTF